MEARQLLLETEMEGTVPGDVAGTAGAMAVFVEDAAVNMMRGGVCE